MPHRTGDDERNVLLNEMVQPYTQYALSPEEMSHLVSVMDQPEALAHSAQALRDYIEIIETEALKRGGAGASDPLLAAREKFRERKAYGG